MGWAGTQTGLANSVFIQIADGVYFPHWLGNNLSISQRASFKRACRKESKEREKKLLAASGHEVVRTWQGLCINKCFTCFTRLKEMHKSFTRWERLKAGRFMQYWPLAGQLQKGKHTFPLDRINL